MPITNDQLKSYPFLQEMYEDEYFPRFLVDKSKANESDLETGAREAIGGDFAFIVKAYGFDIDVEDVIATRDW